MKKTIACLLCAVLALFVSACARKVSSPPSSLADTAVNTPSSSAASEPAPGTAEIAFPYTFTDSLGNKITLEKRPTRVAVLFSSYTDVWQTAGGTVSISVGESVDRGFVSADCVLVDTGPGQSSIDTEQLVAQKPDFVIGTADYEVQVDTAAFCRDNGIPAAVFHVDTFEEYLSMLKICCDITGDQASYQMNGVEVGKRIAETLKLATADTQPPPDILFVRAGSSGKSTKAKTARDNFVCAMLNELGTKNIADNAPVLLDGLSLEEIVVSDPDFIFISTMGNETAAKDYMNSVLQSAGWKDLTAVKEGRYTYLPKDLFHYKPNAQWDRAYAYLFNFIHPEQKK